MRYYFKTSYGYRGNLNIKPGLIMHNYKFCDDCESKEEVRRKHSSSRERVVDVFTAAVFDESGNSKRHGNIRNYKKC